MVVSPGLVYPSGKPATTPDYDCEVGNLLTRESWGQLKSFVSKALSTSWPVRLTVRTPGFHPGNRGSIPLRASNFTKKSGKKG